MHDMYMHERNRATGTVHVDVEIIQPLLLPLRDVVSKCAIGIIQCLCCVRMQSKVFAICADLGPVHFHEHISAVKR